MKRSEIRFDPQDQHSGCSIRPKACSSGPTNHWFYFGKVFADLALRRGMAGQGRRPDMASVIPAYDAVIFDEAHQLEDVATTFFGVRASSARVDALVAVSWQGLILSQ